MNDPFTILEKKDNGHKFLCLCTYISICENRKMNLEIVTVYVSDCCGAYLDDAQIEHGICHDCGEHCEVLTEEYPATPVCGG